MNERNYGIDLLKIWSMFGVVMIHVLRFGVGLEKAQRTIETNSLLVLMVLVYPSVNCFAIISGFVSYKDSGCYKYSNFLNRWVQVFFYSLGMELLSYFLGVSSNIRFGCALPVSTYQYWYFSAYALLFFMIPFLNKLVQTVDIETKKVLVLFIIFTFYLAFANHFSDPFFMRGGFSSLWLIILYVFGAFLKKNMVLKKISLFHISLMLILSIVTACGLVLSNNNEFVMMYTSPFIFIMSFGYVALFYKIRIDKTDTKIVGMISNASFAVYIIHMHKLFLDNVITEKFAFIINPNPIVSTLMCICITCSIFAICIVIEKLRETVFNVLKINNAIEFAKRQFDRVTNEYFTIRY